jgi:hypothetical protein
MRRWSYTFRWHGNALVPRRHSLGRPRAERALASNRSGQPGQPGQLGRLLQSIERLHQPRR